MHLDYPNTNQTNYGIINVSGTKIEGKENTE